VTRDTLTLGAVRVEVARWGNAHRDTLPILLLHEGLGSIALWRDFPNDLAAATGREVIAWSRQGHGWSDPLPVSRRPDYMHLEAELLPELHRRLGVPRAHWLGHSDGASIALIGAALFPDLLGALITMAPHVLVEDITVTSIGEIGASYRGSDMGKRMARYHSDPDHVFARWLDIWLDPAFRDWNIELLLPSIRAPALLIQGCDDKYGTMDQLDRIAAALPETERRELDACGHSPHRDRPNEVIEAIATFLQDRN
jgi:pimeloyl-ACP methyl ester carboxylesterase